MCKILGFGVMIYENSGTFKVFQMRFLAAVSSTSEVPSASTAVPFLLYIWEKAGTCGGGHTSYEKNNGKEVSLVFYSLRNMLRT